MNRFHPFKSESKYIYEGLKLIEKLVDWCRQSLIYQSLTRLESRMWTTIYIAAYCPSIIFLFVFTCISSYLWTQVRNHFLKLSVFQVPWTLNVGKQSWSSAGSAYSSRRSLIHLQSGSIDVETGGQSHCRSLSQ